MATNEQILESITDFEKRITPLVEGNKKRLDDLEPLVRNHQLILYGDPDNRVDEGMIGVLNNINELVENIKSWIKPIAISLIGWALLTGIQKVLEIAAEFQSIR